ncbi:hypothetical protein H6P81_011916 [Aristolochia fimbriata]|uniref:Translation initiation factor eIF2B subunit epsilon n=1 Tax=Aristolochia fimbriata TaxID=158543 RepID=A0AAV7EEX7_ARIFI|nr:hypothetical protein H6P81_011916 [Aristolochia fimbriata]
MSQKRASKVSEDPEELVHVPLQAILLADSFAQKFRPITLERPKVLLPLVNVPMIDYTLAWLESAGVEEVFVFCCAHAKQVIDHLEKSQWLRQPHFAVSTIESHDSTSAGDALRFISEKNVIHGDFILVSGDTVSNMCLKQALQEHKERRKKDSNTVMTMVIKRSKPSQLIHQSRLGDDEILLAIDPETKQLLLYEDKAELSKGTITLDKTLLADNPAVCLHSDMQDCYTDICSQEVLSLFSENFDYQHLRRHFVKGLLLDDIMGYKIFTHEIHSSYAARVDNFRSYDTISKDITQRWTYPFVPDVQFCGNCPLSKLYREGIYKAVDVTQSRSAKIGPFTLVGSGTSIGDNSTISNSIVGRGCIIGSNVSIEGSYIWDNVTIHENCKITHAIVCDGVVIKAGATLEPGVILSFKVAVGPMFVVPAYSKVSLLPQPKKQDSDEELEYADSSSVVVEHPVANALGTANGEFESDLSVPQSLETSEVGASGLGYIWSISDMGHGEEWKHSIAPVSAGKLSEFVDRLHADLDLSAQEVGTLPASGELKPDSVIDSDDDTNEEFKGDYGSFEKEVEATFQRAVHEGVQLEHVLLEIKSLRMAYNADSIDVVGAVFYSMMKLALQAPHNSNGELFQSVKKVLSDWNNLLVPFCLDMDDKIEIIMKLEEMSSESAKEFSPLFSKILAELYDQDFVTEPAILSWASEKAGADESDKIFLKQAEPFIQWLKEAEEESSDENK